MKFTNDPGDWGQVGWDILLNIPLLCLAILALVSLVAWVGWWAVIPAWVILEWRQDQRAKERKGQQAPPQP